MINKQVFFLTLWLGDLNPYVIEYQFLKNNIKKKSSVTVHKGMLTIN